MRMIFEPKIKVASRQTVLQSEIMYLESAWNYTCIHTVKKQLVSSRTLKLFSDRVDANAFIKINRGLMVNISYINEINKERNDAFIVLQNGKKLPISRRKYGEVIGSLVRIN
jgi:two-component system, LytTR family, response regulator